MVETKWGELTRQLKFVQWDETYQVVIRIIIVIIVIIRSNIYIYIYIYYFYPKEDDDISVYYYNSLSFSWFLLYDIPNGNYYKSNCISF